MPMVPYTRHSFSGNGVRSVVPVRCSSVCSSGVVAVGLGLGTCAGTLGRPWCCYRVNDLISRHSRTPNALESYRTPT